MNLFTTATLSLSAACLLAGHASADTITIREGLDGYAGTQDTWFSERTTGGELNGFPEGSYIRTAQWASANQQSLLRFDGVENLLAPGGTINSAILRLTVPSDITFSDGEANAVHQMLVDWIETDTYGATPWAGGATQQIDLDGIEAAAVATANSDSYADGVTFLIAQGTVIELDVTAIVQNWANGDANYGFMFQSSGNAAGNGLFMASSEYVGADGEVARPTLIIDGDVVPEPGSIALLAFGGALLARRRR